MEFSKNQHLHIFGLIYCPLGGLRDEGEGPEGDLVKILKKILENGFFHIWALFMCFDEKNFFLVWLVQLWDLVIFSKKIKKIFKKTFFWKEMNRNYCFLNFWLQMRSQRGTTQGRLVSKKWPILDKNSRNFSIFHFFANKDTKFDESD